ncbi:hypothetical protein D9757_001827 [Collybiopsis confluens]|uniref:Uncharacterized protein n=1 Tax=Collybiopsis confluens TaxID=2823264 RepID=A0A8H5MF95_9AGAR|nr:hypothetical protein D9757_001827 [Collybiopsis confluens]
MPKRKFTEFHHDAEPANRPAITVVEDTVPASEPDTDYDYYPNYVLSFPPRPTHPATEDPSRKRLKSNHLDEEIIPDSDPLSYPNEPVLATPRMEPSKKTRIISPYSDVPTEYSEIVVIGSSPRYDLLSSPAKPDQFQPDNIVNFPSTSTALLPPLDTSESGPVRSSNETVSQSPSRPALLAAVIVESNCNTALRSHPSSPEPISTRSTPGSSSMPPLPGAFVKEDRSSLHPGLQGETSACAFTQREASIALSLSPLYPSAPVPATLRSARAPDPANNELSSPARLSDTSLDVDRDDEDGAKCHGPQFKLDVETAQTIHDENITVSTANDHQPAILHSTSKNTPKPVESPAPFHPNDIYQTTTSEFSCIVDEYPRMARARVLTVNHLLASVCARLGQAIEDNDFGSVSADAIGGAEALALLW